MKQIAKLGNHYILKVKGHLNPTIGFNPMDENDFAVAEALFISMVRDRELANRPAAPAWTAPIKRLWLKLVA